MKYSDLRYVYIIMSKDRPSSLGFDTLEKAQQECRLKGYTFEVSPFIFSQGNNGGELKIHEIQIR